MSYAGKYRMAVSESDSKIQFTVYAISDEVYRSRHVWR